MKKIFDIMFWTAFISTIVHFFIWTQIDGSSDKDFIKQTNNILFMSGALVVLSYMLMPGPPQVEDIDDDIK